MPQLRLLISSVALIGLSAVGMPQGAIASTAKIDTVQCPSGTVYRGGSKNPCQQQKQNHIDVCLHVDRLGGCDRTMDDLKQFSPPDDIGGPRRSQGSGTRNKPH